MTGGKEVRQSCSQACKIRTVRREEGGVENTVGILVKKKRGDVRGGCQTLTWAAEGMGKTDNHPEIDPEKKRSLKLYAQDYFRGR